MQDWYNLHTDTAQQVRRFQICSPFDKFLVEIYRNAAQHSTAQTLIGAVHKSGGATIGFSGRQVEALKA